MQISELGTFLSFDFGLEVGYFLGIVILARLIVVIISWPGSIGTFTTKLTAKPPKNGLQTQHPGLNIF